MRTLIYAALVFVAAIALCDVGVRAGLPLPARLSDNFSSAFVQTKIDRLASGPRTTIVLGDSVLWGYRLDAGQAAPALLAAYGIDNVNLTYEGGSPVNDYAVLRVLLANGVRPKLVVFNVNQKVFNAADSAYARIHPSIWPLAEPLIGSADTKLLMEPPDAETPDARVDRAVSHVWKLYAMRTDLREMLFGDVDFAHAMHDLVEVASGAKARSDAAHVPVPNMFEGTYDLSPLDETNVSVHFLRRLTGTLRAEHIPAVAILTPANHKLLHDFIDTPQYRKNLDYVRGILAHDGVRVLDLDRAFASRDFFDNDHLTAPANRRLARILAGEIAAR